MGFEPFKSDLKKFITLRKKDPLQKTEKITSDHFNYDFEHNYKVDFLTTYDIYLIKYIQRSLRLCQRRRPKKLDKQMMKSGNSVKQVLKMLQINLHNSKEIS